MREHLWETPLGFKYTVVDNTILNNPTFLFDNNGDCSTLEADSRPLLRLTILNHWADLSVQEQDQFLARYYDVCYEQLNLQDPNLEELTSLEICNASAENGI